MQCDNGCQMEAEFFVAPDEFLCGSCYYNGFTDTYRPDGEPDAS